MAGQTIDDDKEKATQKDREEWFKQLKGFSSISLEYLLKKSMNQRIEVKLIIEQYT